MISLCMLITVKFYCRHVYKVPEEQGQNWLHVPRQAGKDVRMRVAFLKSRFTTYKGQKDILGRGTADAK